MDERKRIAPCISFFNDRDDIKVYVHLPKQKMFDGERVTFSRETFDHDIARRGAPIGLRIISHAFKGPLSCFDEAELFDASVELRVDRTHEIARLYLFGTRIKMKELAGRTRSRSRLKRMVFSIHDNMLMDHLIGTDERAKRFFEAEIRRAIDAAMTIEKE